VSWVGKDEITKRLEKLFEVEIVVRYFTRILKFGLTSDLLLAKEKLIKKRMR
jgi:hypothetical protein